MDEIERVADELDGVLGQASTFDASFGYYCDGVGAETAVLPRQWRDRAVVFETPATGGVSALAPEPDDLGLAKLAAGREKDMAWLLAAADDGLLDFQTMRARLPEFPVERVSGGLVVLETRLAVLEHRRTPR